MLKIFTKQESTGLMHFNDSKDLIEYSHDIGGIYKNIEEYNPYKKQRILIVFDDMMVDMLSIKNLSPIVTELFVRDRKLNMSIALLHNLFCCTKKCQTKFYTLFHYENPNEQELQQIAFNYSSDIDFRGFINHYKKCTVKPYFFGD